jgi:hypothetical protein
VNLFCKLLTDTFILVLALLFFTLLPFRKTGRSALYQLTSWIAQCLSKVVLILPAFASGLEGAVEEFSVRFLREFPDRELRVVPFRDDVAS